MPAQQDSQAALLSAASLFLLDSIDTRALEPQLLALLLISKAHGLRRPVPRGPYNAVKSDDFLLKLIYEFGDRSFKAFLR